MTEINPVRRDVKYDDLVALLGFVYAAQYGKINFHEEALDSAHAKISQMQGALFTLEDAIRELLETPVKDLSILPDDCILQDMRQDSRWREVKEI